MMYSAAQFLSPDDTLEQAQLNKLERICQKLALKPEDHLLEIGTGARQRWRCMQPSTMAAK